MRWTAQAELVLEEEYSASLASYAAVNKQISAVWAVRVKFVALNKIWPHKTTRDQGGEQRRLEQSSGSQHGIQGRRGEVDARMRSRRGPSLYTASIRRELISLI
jgi:hypothetical protein